jgi:hypothetical protein
MSGEQIHEHAIMRGIEVLHQDKRQARAGGYAVEQGSAGLQAAGGRTNPDDGKRVG